MPADSDVGVQRSFNLRTSPPKRRTRHAEEELVLDGHQLLRLRTARVARLAPPRRSSLRDSQARARLSSERSSLAATRCRPRRCATRRRKLDVVAGHESLRQAPSARAYGAGPAAQDGTGRPAHLQGGRDKAPFERMDAGRAIKGGAVVPMWAGRLQQGGRGPVAQHARALRRRPRGAGRPPPGVVQMARRREAAHDSEQLRARRLKPRGAVALAELSAPPMTRGDGLRDQQRQRLTPLCAVSARSNLGN